ncbi:MAG: GAF domain-containing sensor histidine kinase, partial [Actinomycetota bacterium]|nr:GAF domain-containing sensor histidine kinase [Actinomycetota bacterium]
IYVLVVGYLGALFRTGGNLLISLVATGLVAVLFAPLRDRLQRGVNRLTYGERDEPYKVLSRLGRRLEGTLSPEAVLPTIVENIARTLRLPHVAIWLADGEALRLGAAYGDAPARTTVWDTGAVESLRRAPDGLHPAELAPSGEYGAVLDECGVALVLPLTHRGELVGALCMAPRSPGETFSPADRQLLRDLATQAGTAADAVRLTVALRTSLENLRRSRERLVAAQEEERRRIQRDLHDGLGPVLASMRLRLEACLDMVEETEAPLSDDLERLYDLVGQATSDIRRLVYDLRPPVLDQLGLVPAIRQHCERFGRESGIEAGFEADPYLSIPAAAEVTLLRVVQEALLNVHKHAHATRVDVRLGCRDGWIELEIRDDGVGLETNGRGGGTGIGSMRERAELLGGALHVAGHSGAGTEVTVRIPTEIPSEQVSR